MAAIPTTPLPPGYHNRKGKVDPELRRRFMQQMLLQTRPEAEFERLKKEDVGLVDPLAKTGANLAYMLGGPVIDAVANRDPLSILAAGEFMLDPLNKAAGVPLAKTKKMRGYNIVQREIDDLEDILAKSGKDPLKLYDPAMYKPSQLPAGYTPMPSKLAKLYRERDAIQSTEDMLLADGLAEKLQAGGLPSSEARSVARDIAELDSPPALRTAYYPGMKDRQHGVVANKLLKYVSKNITKEPDDVWVNLKAIPAGTADNPGIQLVMETAPGFGKPRNETLEVTQRLLDAVFEGNAPVIPGVERARRLK